MGSRIHQSTYSTPILMSPIHLPSVTNLPLHSTFYGICLVQLLIIVHVGETVEVKNKIKMMNKLTFLKAIDLVIGEGGPIPLQFPFQSEPHLRVFIS